jgi:hypothetical protein
LLFFDEEEEGALGPPHRASSEAKSFLSLTASERDGTSDAAHLLSAAALRSPA